MFERVGLDSDGIATAVKLADIDGDGNVSRAEFVTALRTLHDGTQKQDIWEVILMLRRVHTAMDEHNSRLAALEGRLLGTVEDPHKMQPSLRLPSLVSNNVIETRLQALEDTMGTKLDALAHAMQDLERKLATNVG